MLIDTHSHLNFNAYKGDLDAVIKKTLDENIWIINVGSKYETSKKAVEIAEKYAEGVYAAVGLHPIYAGAEFIKTKTDPDEGEFLIKEQNFDAEKYKKLALSGAKGSKKIVAIGEIGLDYYYRPKTKTKLELFKEKQKQIFTEQLNLAQELNLPAIIHCRMAHGNLIEILKSQISMANNQKLRGVVHCFTGTVEEMKQYLDLGFYIGFNGIIFKLNLNEAIKECPADKILLETDCPYLIPPLARQSPQGESGRNEPIFVKYIAKTVAKIKNMSYEEVSETTTQNAKKLFNI